MKKNSTAFRERFQRWKNGEQVYENGRVIPHYAGGSDGNEEVSDNTRVVNTRVNVADHGKVGPSLFELMQAKHNAEQVGPAPNISQYEKDLNRQRAETKQWAQQKKAAEEATDKFMLGLLDPRYAVAGFAVGQAMKGFGSLLNAGKNLYKSYKVSKAIDKAVDSEILAKPVINTAYKNIRKPYIINLEREKKGVNIGINSGIKRDYNNPINNILSVQQQDKMLGEYVGRGAERQVFTDRRNPDRVIKIGGGLNGEEKITDFDQLNEAIDYTLEMNKLPSVEPISYEGFIEEGGQFIPWFSQKKVTPLNKVADPFHVFTKSYIMPNGKPVTGKLSAIRLLDRDKVFVPLGYNPVPTMPGAFSVHGYPYRVTDLGQKNIGLDSAGNIKIFDPMIEL